MEQQNLTDINQCHPVAGEPAILIVASDSDLRFLYPYKSHESSVNQVSATPHHKMDSMDVLFGKTSSRVFWTDHQLKRISSMQVTIPSTRVKRDAAPNEPRVLVSVVVYRSILSRMGKIIIG